MFTKMKTLEGALYDSQPGDNAICQVIEPRESLRGQAGVLDPIPWPLAVNDRAQPGSVVANVQRDRGTSARSARDRRSQDNSQLRRSSGPSTTTTAWLRAARADPISPPAAFR